MMIDRPKISLKFDSYTLLKSREPTRRYGLIEEYWRKLALPVLFNYSSLVKRRRLSYSSSKEMQASEKNPVLVSGEGHTLPEPTKQEAHELPTTPDRHSESQFAC